MKTLKNLSLIFTIVISLANCKNDDSSQKKESAVEVKDLKDSVNRLKIELSDLIPLKIELSECNQALENLLIPAPEGNGKIDSTKEMSLHELRDCVRSYKASSDLKDKSPYQIEIYKLIGTIIRLEKEISVLKGKGKGK